MAKYRLTEETKVVDGVTLHRIQAIKNFNGVLSGTLGGFVESEKNLSQECGCWIFNDAICMGNGLVKDNAIVTGTSIVKDYAIVKGNAKVLANSTVSGTGFLSDNASTVGKCNIQGQMSGDSTVATDILLAKGVYLDGFIKIEGSGEVCAVCFSEGDPC